MKLPERLPLHLRVPQAQGLLLMAAVACGDVAQFWPRPWVALASFSYIGAGRIPSVQLWSCRCQGLLLLLQVPSATSGACLRFA